LFARVLLEEVVAEPAQAGSRIDDDKRSVVAVDLKAGGVAAVFDGPGPGVGREPRQPQQVICMIWPVAFAF